jgi:glucose-1-phosphate thymidylyltransferase
MLPVANRPVVEYVVDALLEVGIERLVVVIGHRGDRVKTHLTERYPDVDLTFVTQRSRLGSGHALLQAEEYVGETFLVANGDTVVGAGVVRAVLDRFAETAPAATLAVAESDHPEEYGVVTLDHGIVADVDEHPVESRGYLVNVGVYALRSSVFDALRGTDAPGGDLDLPGVVARLDGPVTSVRVGGDWLDPSTPWDLLDVTDRLLARREGALVDPSARVHASAVVEPGAAVGPGCELCAGVVALAGACLQENVHVGPNSVVERSVLATDVRVGAGAVVRDSVVGAGATIGDGVVSPGGRADVVADGRLYPDVRVGAVVAARATVGAHATLVAGAQIGADAVVHPGVVLSGTVAERAEVVC